MLYNLRLLNFNFKASTHVKHTKSTKDKAKNNEQGINV